MSTLTYNGAQVTYGNGSTSLTVSNGQTVNLTNATAYYINVIVQNGGILTIDRTCDFRCSGTLQVDGGGVVKNYATGGGNTGQNAQDSNSHAGAGGGGSAPYAGGNGGAGSGSGNSGSAGYGGAATYEAPVTQLASFTTTPSANYGGGSGGSSGGGGGTGAGPFKIIAKNIVNNGTISATGTNGGNGSGGITSNDFGTGAWSTGGGGGGGGGSIFIFAEEERGSGSYNLSGGAGGYGGYASWTGGVGGSSGYSAGGAGGAGGSGALVRNVGVSGFSGVIYGYNQFATISYTPDTPTILFDAQSSLTSTSGTSNSVSHTIGSGADRLLLVNVTLGGTSHAMTTAVTYAGLPLKLCDYNWINTSGNTTNTSAYAGQKLRTEIWYLVNPPTGTANITVTRSSGSYLVVTAASYSGINQTYPFRSFAARQFDTGTTGNVTLQTRHTDGNNVSIGNYDTAYIIVACDANATVTFPTEYSKTLNGGTTASAVSGSTYLNVATGVAQLQGGVAIDPSVTISQSCKWIMTGVNLRVSSNNYGLTAENIWNWYLHSADLSSAGTTRPSYPCGSGYYRRGLYLKIMYPFFIAKNSTEIANTSTGIVKYETNGIFDLNGQNMYPLGEGGGASTTGNGNQGQGYYESTSAPTPSARQTTVYTRSIGGTGAWSPSPTKSSAGYGGFSTLTYSLGKGGGGGGSYGYGGNAGNENDTNRGTGGGGGYEWWSGQIPYSPYNASTFPVVTSFIPCGGGGGSGSGAGGWQGGSTNNYGAAGGTGGGAIIIQCGIFKGSGSINANGRDGGDCNSSNLYGGGGGGGGGGGCIIIATNVYNSTATFNAYGGRGGDTYIANQSSGQSGGGGGGGGGIVYIAYRTAFTNISTPNVAGGRAGVPLYPLSYPSQSGSTGYSNIQAFPQYLGWYTPTGLIVWS